MQSLISALTFRVVFAALLATGTVARADGWVVIGGAPGPWSYHAPYGPYAYGPYPYGPYRYGAYAPWAVCGPGLCFDAELRRAVRRELRLQELQRESDPPHGGGFPRPGEGLYGAPRYLPPPTPEAQVQPRYRGSGDVRPEYGDAGQAR